MGIRGCLAGILPFLSGAVFVLAPFSVTANSPGEFIIIEESGPAAAFIVPPEQSGRISACNIARGMIEDFNEDLYECSGFRLPVLDKDERAGQVIRFKIEARTAEDEDRFGITFPDERTMLVTGSTVSLRWALNHILQEFAGARYLQLSLDSGDGRIRRHDGSHFPRISSLKVPAREMSFEPSWNISRRAGHNPYWNSRTGNFVYRVPVGHDLFRHAFPVQKYIDEGHFPEYIFPVVGGSRYLPYEDPARERAWREYTGRWSDYGAGWHQCMTDERAVDEAVRNIIAYFDSRPEVHGISIALNDLGDNYCECEGCAPLVGEGRNATGHRDYSEIYFRWANRVVEGVAAEHPGKLFGTLAYRETLTPPGFKLHENIVVYIAYDIQSCQDPDVKAGWLALLEGWSERANYLGRYEYAWGGTVYQMPRVYFELQQEMMRADYEYGARAVWFSGVGGGIEDGPKKYLYNKLMWDVNLDLEDTLNDWYRACVGREAAPYLAEYFRLWEEIWREEAVKTSWFRNSKNRVYLSMANRSYLYAVRPGDLEELRGLMERVKELAVSRGDERQGRRAGWLMADFEYTEAVVYSAGADIFPPSGVPETVEQALAYLGRLEESARRASMVPELHKDRMIASLLPDLSPARGMEHVYTALANVAGLASEPEVFSGLAGASENPGIPLGIRNLIDVFVRMERGEPVANLMLDGAFEEGNKDWRQGTISRAQSYRGENSLRLWLAPPHRTFLSKHGRDFPHKEIEPGMYYVSVMVYIEAEHPDVESYVQFRATPRRADGRPITHVDSANVNVPPGEWTRISVVVNAGSNARALNLDRIHFFNFNRGDTAYIDDVVVVPLGMDAR